MLLEELPGRALSESLPRIIQLRILAETALQLPDGCQSDPLPLAPMSAIITLQQVSCSTCSNVRLG
jgi:hypothetical protein